MDDALLEQQTQYQWRLPASGAMRVPAILYASSALIRQMERQVLEQISRVAALPGIVQAAYAMPDAHWGYGFPIGGVAAFAAEQGGVVSAGGVGFDIACGVRTILSGLSSEQVLAQQDRLAERLFSQIPAGVGSSGKLRLDAREMDAMLSGGARWAVQRGHGSAADLARIEQRGAWPEAGLGQVSAQARRRQQDQMGTLGAGNHYLEVQKVAEIFDPESAAAFGLRENEIVISIHCGSRGLGHQVATEFTRSLVQAARAHGIALPNYELACAPIASREGQAYLAAMRAAANCALANRQVLTQLVRQIFQDIFGSGLELPLLYDVSHNICSREQHRLGGARRQLYVHRKGATRALGPGHDDLPEELRPFGQPVLVGGTMGTASYILAGSASGAELAFSSACHGAGRAMSRTQALKKWPGQAIIRDLAARKILIKTRSKRAAAEEAPAAYKDVAEVVRATVQAGLARSVARLLPLICIKG